MSVHYFVPPTQQIPVIVQELSSAMTALLLGLPSPTDTEPESLAAPDSWHKTLLNVGQKLFETTDGFAALTHNILAESTAYQLCASSHDVDTFLEDSLETCMDGDLLQLDRVEWDPQNMTHRDLIVASFKMIWALDVLGTRGDARMLIQFLLTVARSYRQDVSYHNFPHAVTVMHGMYLLFRQFGLEELFDTVEIFAMMVACVTHDLDHRGQSNQFQKYANTGLYQLYAQSTLEMHHSAFALNILSMEGHDVFSGLSCADNQRALSIVKECILSTDLASFFANRAALNGALENGEIGPNHPLRSALRGAIMNACDLNATHKDFCSVQRTTALIYLEFFEEGRAIRALDANAELSPHLDEASEGQIPAMQLEFIDGVVLPVYAIQAKALPKSRLLLDRIRSTRLAWEGLV